MYVWPARQVTDSRKQALQSGEFVPADKPVKIQGYTAERLIEELGLHPIGAYKTLADLCDDPSGTLELIKRGIIKK